MKESLLVTLISKNIIKRNSKISATVYKEQFVGGNPVPINDELLVQKAIKIKGKMYLVCLSENDNKQYNISSENINTIDGMKPERVADTHNIYSDGTTKYVRIDPITGAPVRRGRKPKKFKERVNGEPK